MHFQQTFSKLMVGRFLGMTEIDLGRIVFLCKCASARLLQGQPNLSNLEILVLEVYQNNRKWLSLGVYKPPNQNDIEFLNRIGAIPDFSFQKYNNVPIVGDFSNSPENTNLQSMMQAFNLNNLIKETTCFQSNNPTQIDLIIKNQKIMCKFSNTFETFLSDHHKLISTISKSGSFKGTPRIKLF